MADNNNNTGSLAYNKNDDAGLMGMSSDTTNTTNNNENNNNGDVVIGVNLVESDRLRRNSSSGSPYLEEGNPNDVQQHQAAALAQTTANGDHDQFKDEGSLKTNKTAKTTISDSYHSDPTNNGAFLQHSKEGNGKNNKWKCYGLIILCVLLVAGVVVGILIAVSNKNNKNNNETTPMKGINEDEEITLTNSPTNYPTNSPTHKPTLDTFAWDIAVMPGSPIVLFSDATLDREIIMKYQIHLRDYVVTAYEKDCQTPLPEEVISVKTTLEPTSNTKGIVSAMFDVKTDNIIYSPAWSNSTSSPVDGYINFCSKIELGVANDDGSSIVSVNFKEDILNVYTPSEWAASFGLYDIDLINKKEPKEKEP